MFLDELVDPFEDFRIRFRLSRVFAQALRCFRARPVELRKRNF